MKLKLPIRLNSIPRIGYLLAVVIVLNAASLIYIASSLGLPSKLQSLIESSVNPTTKLASADYQDYLTLTWKIEALKVKLPTEGVISERLKTHLEELKNELGDNKAVLEDLRTTATTTEKTRERNKVIAQTLDQMEKDVGSGFEGFEAAANEQAAIDSAFYPSLSSTITSVANTPKEVDADPMVACTFDNCEVVQLKRGECLNSVCCSIGNDWKWERTEAACADEQHNYEERKVSTSLYLDGLSFTKNCNADKVALLSSLELEYVKAAQNWYCQGQCYNRLVVEQQKEQEKNRWLVSQEKSSVTTNSGNIWETCSTMCCGLNLSSKNYCPSAINSGNSYDYEGPTKAIASKINDIKDEIQKNIDMFCE